MTIRLVRKKMSRTLSDGVLSAEAVKTNCVNSGNILRDNPEPSLERSRKVQRPSRNGVGLSSPKRTAPDNRVIIWSELYGITYSSRKTV